MIVFNYDKKSAENKISANNKKSAYNFFMYLKRIIEKKISEYLKIYGAIYIQGPRACGKTTTSKLFSKSNVILKKDPIMLEKLSNNYDLVLEGEKPKLIDE
jgi:predicted AAA+ superfamily ATPase